MDDAISRSRPLVGFDSDAASAERLVAVIGELAARLGPVCAHMPDAEFSQLVTTMAQMRLRFDALDRTSWSRAVLRTPTE